MFPALRDRLDEPAANLSGGQQQMLALGMALLGRPRLLMIDELSLGLAPVVVARLADLVRQVAADGTTVLLVEQSVNVALTMATTAYFMERGRVQFSGPAHEMLDRPDLLRAVFLAGGPTPGGAHTHGTARGRPARDGRQRDGRQRDGCRRHGCRPRLPCRQPWSTATRRSRRGPPCSSSTSPVASVASARSRT